jgi:hypothetical protein
MFNEADLKQFSGTENYFRHPLFRGVVYTDGIQFLVENGCSWLLDMAAAHLSGHPGLADECCGMIFLTLTKHENGTASFEGKTDEDMPILLSEEISWTDFPLDSLILYAAYEEGCWIICLPSEH